MMTAAQRAKVEEFHEQFFGCQSNYRLNRKSLSENLLWDHYERLKKLGLL